MSKSTLNDCNCILWILDTLNHKGHIRIPQRTLEEQDDVEAGEAVVEAAHREQKQPFRKVGREDSDAGSNVVVT